MKTAGLALAKFAIILVCCISPTLGNKRIVRQLRSGAPAFGFYTSEGSSNTAITLRGEIASVDRWTTLKEFRGNGVTYEIRDGQNSPGVKVGEHVTARYYETVAIRSRKTGRDCGIGFCDGGNTCRKARRTVQGWLYSRVEDRRLDRSIWQESQAADIQDCSRHEPSTRHRGCKRAPWLESRRADSNYANSGHVHFAGQHILRPSAFSRVPTVIDAHDLAPGSDEAGEFVRITSLCAVADSVSFAEPGTELQAKPARS